MAIQNDEVRKQMDELYERYGKPLEAEHWGEFLAIAPDGRYVLGPTMEAAAISAVDSFGPGVFLYKVGDRVVGKIR